MPAKRPSKFSPPAINPESVLRDFVSQHPSNAEAARRLGINAGYLGDMLKGSRTIGPKVLAKLGLMKTVVYAEKAS